MVTGELGPRENSVRGDLGPPVNSVQVKSVQWYQVIWAHHDIGPVICAHSPTAGTPTESSAVGVVSVRI